MSDPSASEGSESDPSGVESETESASVSLSVDGLETYLHCPRRYEFEHVSDLEGNDGVDADRDPPDYRLSIPRRAICDGLRTDPETPDALEDAALERLDALFSEFGERFHSLAQRRHERRVLEAIVRAYCESVGADHARGLAALRGRTDGELVGPELPLSAAVQLPERDATVHVDATVDYLYRADSAITAVRFVPSLRPLGLLRYRSSWDGDVAARFEDHFDPDEDRFEPGLCGTLLETAVVLDAVRKLRDRLGLGDRPCRYRYVALADRSNLSINWVRETVDTSLETVDLTDVFLDHHTFGMTHEHRNRLVESELTSVVDDVVAGRFGPGTRWEEIVEHSCGECAYTVCCQEYVSREVRFDE